MLALFSKLTYHQTQARVKNLLIASFIGAVSILNAQDISLSGKVIDATGKPLAGVALKLLSAGNETVTGADGNYNLSGKVNGIFKTDLSKNSIQYANNKFLIYSSEATTLDIALYDLQGLHIASLFNGILKNGKTELTFPLENYGSKIFLLRMKMGEVKSLFKLISLGKSTHHLVPQPMVSVGVLSKKAATDWLQASKGGYASNVQAITNYTGILNFTLTTSTAPDFGPKVLIFDPTMPMANIQKQIDDVYAVQIDNHMGPERYALLFKPGAYTLTVDVGHYTHVAGLGAMPDDVAITGAVRSIATGGGGVNNVTLSFFRTCENLSINPTNKVNTWALSQGSAFRRVHVKGSLNLSLGGWASGGYLSDSKIDGQVNSGSQQQWFSRNNEWLGWSGGVWNMVLLGNNNAPAEGWPAKPFTVIPQTTQIREKPFLTLMGGEYFVTVPGLRKNVQGNSWSTGTALSESLPINQFYIAKSDKDNANSINAALAQGKNLILTPGIYNLDKSILVTRPNTVILGLGYPTLVPDNGTTAMLISDVDGVKASGFIVDAGVNNSATLLQIGETGSSTSHVANPTSVSDVFCRVGGGTAGKASSCVTINSNNVIADHFWLWRADHGAGAAWNENKSKNGLIVNGADVIVYGLFVEHFQEHQTLWNGEGGKMIFYQSEMPYDVPSQVEWQHNGVNGFASYKVASTVKTHEAWGVGVYCAFQDATVISANAIETSTAPGVLMHHLVSIFLTGSGEISNVINGTGGAVNSSKQKATSN